MGLARLRASGSSPVTHLVMFDIDGTLVDSTGFDTALYAQAVREVLAVEVDRTWGAYRHVTDSGILEEILAQRGAGEPCRWTSFGSP